MCCAPRNKGVSASHQYGYLRAWIESEPSGLRGQWQLSTEQKNGAKWPRRKVWFYSAYSPSESNAQPIRPEQAWVTSTWAQPL